MLFAFITLAAIRSSVEISLILLFLFFDVLFLSILYTYFIKYTFLKDVIIRKYPFFPEKKYKINEIIGWQFTIVSGDNLFLLFFDKKYLSIELSSKESIQIINKFVNDNYDIVKNRNIEKIKINGYQVVLNKKSSIIFYEYNFELINYKKMNRKYLYSDILSIDIKGDILFGSVKIIMKDNKKIKFMNYYCKGGIGLFEYLGIVNK
jgi:hypothetical protein